MHEFWMNKAIELAQKGSYTARPNPMVGCVLLHQKEPNLVIGEGYHAYCGGPHAEVVALNYARAQGYSTEGAIAYVSLAPCCHTGRTPPCVNALIQAKVSEVIYAINDPNPISEPNLAEKLLIQAGIRVTKGILADKATKLNQGFIFRMRDKRPYVRAKVALSLDGNMALNNHKSQWITGETARRHSQHYRALSGAIITGMGTLIHDKPRLTVREERFVNLEKFTQPIAVVIDPQKQVKTNLDGSLFENKLFFDQNIPIVLNLLAQEYGINDVLLESGPGLFNQFLTENLIDEVIIYLAPKLLGKGAMNLSQFGPLEELTQARDWVFQSVETVGTDIAITAIPK